METPIHKRSNKTPIRKRDKKTRFYIDNELLARGYPLLWNKIISVYCVLAKYANSKTQECFPSYEILMLESGVRNRSTIRKTLTILEALNIIEIRPSKRRRSNHYRLLDTSVWKSPSSLNVETTKAVSKRPPMQSQNSRKSSLKSETGSLIKNSNKEISFGIEENINRVRKELEKTGVLKKKRNDN